MPTRVRSASAAIRRSCSVAQGVRGLREVRAPQAEELDDRRRRSAERGARRRPRRGSRRAARSRRRPCARGRTRARLRVGRTTQRSSTSEKLRAMRRGSRRRERRHHVVRRAERVVLVAVLDVGDAADVIEPGRELDARRDVGASSPRVGQPLRSAAISDEQRRGSPPSRRPSGTRRRGCRGRWSARARRRRSRRARRRRRGAARRRRGASGVAWSALLPRPCSRSSSLASRRALAPRAGRMLIPTKSMKSPAMTRRQRFPAQGCGGSARAGSRGRRRRAPNGGRHRASGRSDRFRDERPKG